MSSSNTVDRIINTEIQMYKQHISVYKDFLQSYVIFSVGLLITSGILFYYWYYMDMPYTLWPASALLAMTVICVRGAFMARRDQLYWTGALIRMEAMKEKFRKDDLIKDRARMDPFPKTKRSRKDV